MTCEVPSSEPSQADLDTNPAESLSNSIVEHPHSGIESDFPIVGIAASAGGLEAFTQLLTNIPSDTGMAFVLIQHLSPDRESLLTEILTRATKMLVCEAQNGMVVERDRVYTIPPNTQMRLAEGVLNLSPREKVFGKYMPGDTFFSSLAADRGHQAIAVVLSGGDGDGAVGLTAIKAAGGWTFAQRADTAKYDSMPNAAIATGNVDFVLSPEQIGVELVNFSRDRRWVSPQSLEAIDGASAPPATLETIFALLRSTTGVDFSHYKPKTIARRIHRRMLLCKLEQLGDYAAYLAANPTEVRALYEEILIHVTSFFRDPEAFELLKTQVFPTIAQHKSAELPIRIWVAGCSTGEEVYSISICLLEFWADGVKTPPIQIFATDISELSIDKARSGIYAEERMVDVSPERRHRFFTELEGGYRIAKAVRELCVFARQDLGSDPPFSNIDLISCRNVLIYLADSLQQRIMPIFHYSLNPNGFLLLGTSESTGKYADLFAVVEKKYRIYAKNLTTTLPTFSFTPSSYPKVKSIDLPKNSTVPVRHSLPAALEEFDLHKQVDRSIANRYHPVGVVVDDLEPLAQPTSGTRIDPTTPVEDLEQENVRLRQELTTAIAERTATQEYLRAVIQEQEYSNQDLKVANEEILSSNEELQSTNEELETAKEEIQATNEELNTTNDELHRRNSELDRVNNDLINLLDTINVSILMLTNDLRIRRFTPMAQRLFNFIPPDIGRPLSDIRTNLNIPDLDPLVLEVLETLNVKELEIQTHTGYWYTLRIRPYRTTENQIDGVVLVLLDIDALKRSAATIEAARNYAEAIVETVQVPLLVLESDFRVNTANRAFCETFEVSQIDTARLTIFDLGNGQWNIAGLRSRLEDIFTNDSILENFEVEHLFERIGRKTMLLNGLKIIEAGNTQRILLSIEDITAAKRDEVVRQQFESERAHLLAQEQLARQEAETANRAKDDFLSNLSHELRNPLTAIIGWAQLLRTHKLEQTRIDRGLDTIYRSARAQSQLIEDMLDLSRITSGKLQLNPQRLDVVAIVNTAIESVQLAADAKSIQLSTNLTLTTMMGDTDRLGQVLWNLLTNAIKFTPPGGRVDVTVAPMQNYAQIRVGDTGQGISAELLPEIFDRFRQGDSSSSKGTQGLGLGLAIVRHLVELHGGSVWAQSAGEGQGSTIVIQLPLDLAASDSATVATAQLSRATPEDVSLAGLRILVVDDEVDILDLMKYILENVGAEVETATSTSTAMAALKTDGGKYDALLADIGMPGADGFALIRQVRALTAAAGGQIPSAAITAYVSDRQRQLALAAGFQVHLAKPVAPAQLIQMVATLTGRSSNND
jgi:two-component system, chemotaxis family, CheB/CheR fusion protein